MKIAGKIVSVVTYTANQKPGFEPCQGSHIFRKTVPEFRSKKCDTGIIFAPKCGGWKLVSENGNTEVKCLINALELQCVTAYMYNAYIILTLDYHTM